MNNLFVATFLVLLVLKLTSVIAVSWWIVFSPIFIGLSVLIAVFGAACVVASR